MHEVEKFIRLIIMNYREKITGHCNVNDKEYLYNIAHY